MTARRRLPLYEQILLLALHNEKGTLSQSFSDYAIAGAVVTELIALGRLELEDDKRRLVTVTDPTPTGDPILDECLERIAGAKRRARLTAWIPRLAKIKGLRHRVAARLVADGVLRDDETKLLGLFTRKRYPEIDPRPEAELVERLRTAIFTDSVGVDVDTCLLVSLADGADLLNNVFGRRELRTRKARVKHLTEDELVGRSTKDAIAAANAAVAMTAIMPAIMITTTS